MLAGSRTAAHEGRSGILKTGKARALHFCTRVLSAGLDGAGQDARITSDASGNVAVVSGPSGGRDLVARCFALT
jgi:hypothetical protein